MLLPCFLAASIAPAAAQSPPRVVAQESAPSRTVATRVISASLFKNGLAFARREGTVEAGSKEVRFDALPAPVHGTFWITADPAQLQLGTASVRRTQIRELASASSVEELLRANIGHKLTLSVGEKDTLIGTLLAMPDPKPGDVDDDPRNYRPPAMGDLVLLDVGNGTAAFSWREVKRVLSSDGPLMREFERRRDGVSMTLSIASPASAQAPLSILYLERGLTWVPSYAIDLSDEKKAVLTAKAEVIDEAEDLDGTTLQFVTGFPNLQFAHVVDPIALRGNLDAFLNALGQSAPRAGPVVAQQVLSNRAYSDFDSASFPVAGAPIAGSTVEDLFLYEQKGVTLKRGERGLYPLFSVRVPYEHLYEWGIADTIDERQPRERDSREGEPREQQEIWHSVRLSNDSSLPWTTAPAMTMKGGNLLGQDTLTYAAIGAKTTVRITRAIDVQGEQAEYEISRDRNAAQFYGNAYDKVVVKGELRATNYKREAVRLEIKKRIQGEVTKNPNEAKVVTVAEGLRRVNPNTRLTWSVPLEPGKTAEIAYEYTLFVRP